MEFRLFGGEGRGALNRNNSSQVAKKGSLSGKKPLPMFSALLTVPPCLLKLPTQRTYAAIESCTLWSVAFGVIL